MPTPSFGASSQDTPSNQGTPLGGNGREFNPDDPFYKGHASDGFVFTNGRWHRRRADGGLDVVPTQTEGKQGIKNVFDGRTDPFTGLDTPQEADRKKKAADALAAQGQTDGISARMQAFIDSMLGPMDKNDPVYQGLMQAGTDAAQRANGRAGLAGRSTLGATNAASTAQQNVLPWMQARQQAGQQMLGQLSNRDISLANLDQGQQRIDQGLAESKYNANKNTMTTLGSIGGGIIGGIYGGPGGATAGAQLGGATLGSLGPSAPSYSGPGYTPGGGYKPSGSGGSGF